MKQFMYFFALFIAVVMTACSSKDDYLQGSSKDPIVIKASINGMDTKTRALNDATTLQNTAFANGAKINVYFETCNTGTIDNYPEKGYITYEKGESGWTTTDVSTLYWPADNGLDIIGIYPSNVNLNSESFTVNTSQGEDERYQASDLMFATLTQYNHDAINLQFKHLLSKITIKVDPNGLMNSVDFVNTLYRVALRNIYTSVSIGSGFRVTPTGSRDETYVEAYWDQSGYNPTNGVSCIIPPQTVDAGTEFININIDDQADYYYTVPTGGHTFEGGKEYIFNIKLLQTGIELGNIDVKGWDTQSPINGDAK